MKPFQNIILMCLCVFALFSCKNKQEKELASTENDSISKPNILFIMADDHAVKAISAYGSEIGKLAPTPNIDRIAHDGAIFSHNYNTNSLCGPSRAVILTGKHSHINGFRMNGDKFDNQQETFPKIFQRNGYQTAVIGKWHLDGKPTGFDYWRIVKDQGHYYNPDFITDDDTTRVNGYVTDLITNFSLKWLKNRDKNKPFLLMMQHKAPHRNWMPALKNTTMYDSVNFPLPDSYFPDFKSQKAAKAQLMNIYKDMYEGNDLKMSIHYGTDSLASIPWPDNFGRMTKKQRATWDSAYRPKNDAFWKMDLHGKALDKYKGQRYLRDYMATIASIDESVGRVLDYLKANGLDKNTLVVYTSDQGFYLGENGWFDKRWMYEPSFRMPLLMKYPRKIKPGSKIDAMTQNLDFAPTFLDIAGIDIPKAMQGISFKDVVYGKTDTLGRDALYYHFYDFPTFHMVKRHDGVKTKRYKLIYFYDDITAWEFYDLKKDPHEYHNLINDKAYKDEIAMMHKKLDSLRKFYKVTDKEFETTSEKKVKKTYEFFDRLRGKPIK